MYDDGATQLSSNTPSLSLYRPLPPFYFRPETTNQPAFESLFSYQAVHLAYEQSQRLQALVRPLLSTTTWEGAVEATRRGEEKLPTELCQLSILRLDIANFTGLMNSYPPDELLADLNTYLDRLTQLVYQHQGDIDKYLGDGFLAFFTNADEAVRASSALQQVIAAFNQNQAAQGRPIFPTRIGIDSGPVAITSLGSSQRQERTVMGLAVTVAERLQALAIPGRTWLSQATFDRLQDQTGCRCLGPIEMKGLSAPVTIYEKGE
jgi:class 3 adenylate cyclase